MAQEQESRRQVAELAAKVQRLQAELAQACRERDEARGWARSEYHQMWDAPFLPDNAPRWLTEPM
jgi:uncharacterized coiled-coil DUF342 family protein